MRRWESIPKLPICGKKIPALKGSVTLHKFPKERAREIDLLLLFIGGNDMRFARLVANAVSRDRSMPTRFEGWFGQVFKKSDASGPL